MLSKSNSSKILFIIWCDVFLWSGLIYLVQIGYWSPQVMAKNITTTAKRRYGLFVQIFGYSKTPSLSRTFSSLHPNIGGRLLNITSMANDPITLPGSANRLRAKTV